MTKHLCPAKKPIPRGQLKKTIDQLEDIDYSATSDELRRDVIEYISGFLIHACNKKSGENVIVDEGEEEEEFFCEESFTNLVNNGGLVMPPKEFTSKVEVLETIFRQTEISCDNIYTTLMEKSSHVQLEDCFKLRYFKTRINAKMRYFNKALRLPADRGEYNKNTQTQKKIQKLKTYKLCLICHFNLIKFIPIENS